jgi:PII-like signaling protein
MQGYQITFFTQQDRSHGDMPLAQWLLEQARGFGFRGATLSGSMEGFGHDGQRHSTNMFDFSDQPIQLTMVLLPEEMEKFFHYLESQKVKVFYTRHCVEFATLGA